MNDTQIPQYPWDEGDKLYASALNAAIANSGQPGGPFLPLSGGTMSTPASLPSQVIITPTPPSNANAPNGAQFASYLTAQFNGGTVNDPSFFNIHASTTIQGAPNTGIWSLYGDVTYQGTGGDGGYVASAGQGVRAVSNAGGTANNPQLWGALFNYIDKTNTDSAQTNHGSAVEIGMACGNTDSANNRRMLGMYLNKWQNTDATPVCHMGIQLAANVGSFDLMLQLYGAFNQAAIDLRQAVQNSGACAIWLADNQTIALTTSGPSGATISGSGNATTLTGTGIRYSAAGANEHAMALGYNGTWLMAYVDGTFTGYVPFALPSGQVPFFTLTNAANDAAAASAGVPVNGLYRNGSAVMQRIT